MASIYNLARMTVAAEPGFETVVQLGVAVSGYNDFDTAGIGDTAHSRYVIHDGTAREVGLGSYTKSNLTFTRDLVLESSNGNGKLFLSASSEVMILAYDTDIGDVVITPPQITASQDNYNPAGLSVASVLRLSSDASRNITGIVAGVPERSIVLRNVGAFSIQFLGEDASSTAANRFKLRPVDTAIVLESGGAMRILYDEVDERWYRFGGTSTV